MPPPSNSGTEYEVYRGMNLQDFYLKDFKTPQGLTWAQMLLFNATQLENNHTFIQWLFPLQEASIYNPDAPTLTADDIAAWKGSEELKSRLLDSFSVMLDFYGFILYDNNGQVSIQRHDNFERRISNWVNPGNHNHLRITRILKSLTLVGLEKYAQAFLKALEAVYTDFPNDISGTTWQYWLGAVKA